MNEMFRGRPIKDRSVALQAPASTRVNMESVSNEIDESERQSEKQRI
jgi:hypothetical protein